MKKITILFLILTITSLHSQTKSGIVLKNMNTGVAPGNDFYNYCNGSWQTQFQLPESDARYGSFNEIYNTNLKRIKVLLDKMANDKAAVAGSDVQRIRDFYLSGMDSIKLDEEKFFPLIPLLSRIDSLKTPQDVQTLKSELDYVGIPLFFTIYVAPDLKNSKKNVLYITQAGYGMGDREYYHNPKKETIRTEYKVYLNSLFTLSRHTEEQSALAADEVLSYETSLSNEALSIQELRETEKTYNPYSFNELQKLTPSFNWSAYFASKKIITPDTVIVTSVSFLKQIDVLMSRAPLNIIQFYAKAQVLMAAAPYLSQKFQYIDFNFRGTAMSGTRSIKPRWERVFKAMDANMGELFSKEYVKQHFSPESKAKVNKMIDNLVASYRQRISTRTWMSAETKVMANKKLDRMIRKIGYPDKWKTYQGMVISKKSYWENVCSARRFEHSDMLSELKKPVNRYKWQMTPVTVNAYYDPSTNEITFPAAILQPPFFDPKADDAANYGTMGSIIGHELTHGFDDEGAKFDAFGNLKMWWTETDFKNFEARSAQLVEQYNACVMLDSLHVNGQLTLGENIADLGGITLSYHAYLRSLGAAKSKTMDGFSGEQRFFIAWAQGWKSKVRDEELKRLLSMDYHSPAYIRAFVPLTNLKEFYEAFGIKAGDKLFREEKDRVEIW